MDLYSEARAFPLTLRGQQPLWTRPALLESGTTAGALRWRPGRRGLRRIHHGRYFLGGSEPDLLDLARAALSLCPPGTVLGFHTAAALYGFGVPATDRVHVVVPPGSRFPQRRGIAVHQGSRPLEAPVILRGLPCAPAARCAIDLARTLPPQDGLPALDAALHASAVDQAALVAELALHSGLRGVGTARLLVPWADGRAECRQESQLRLILRSGGVHGFEPQVEVVDTIGQVRRRIDLGDPRHRVGVEYDGSSHLDRERLRADRERHNWLAGLGWRMRYFTDRDIYQRPEHIVRTVRAAQTSTT